MSGGSYNYLGHVVGLADMLTSVDALERMLTRLTGIPGAEAAARETDGLLTAIQLLEAHVDAVTARLSGVWLAVEWEDSNDGYPGQIEDALRRYRAERLT